MVSNSTPLIYLGTLGDLDLLRQLFGNVLIPEAVYEEVVTAGRGKPGADAVEAARKTWLRVESTQSATRVQEIMDSVGLDRGEAEAIVLAGESGQDTLLMDDESAVRMARTLGFEIVRTAAFYLTAKHYRLIPLVRPKLDELRNVGFWLRDEHYQIILRSAGEL